ncbi:hypothetical protein ACFL27_14650 [candidate division CSSED10-310 bacterium]|uniref:VCBS repeat-containing protein n=1 Tax=candidate division CSSED10-310 bacterium TaxID=2855610 RepID=A0ABV6YZ05_UNCC1
MLLKFNIVKLFVNELLSQDNSPVFSPTLPRGYHFMNLTSLLKLKVKKIMILCSWFLWVASPLFSSDSVASQDQNPIDTVIESIISQLDITNPKDMGQIMKVSPEKIVVNLGQRDKVTPGLTYEVYRETELLKDPIDGTVIGSVPHYLGDIQLTKIFDTLAFAFPVTLFQIPPVAGDLIIRKEPISRLAFYPLQDLTAQNTSFLKIFEEILRYRITQTGRYELVPPQVEENLPRNPQDVAQLLKNGIWHNIDYVIDLSFAATKDIMSWTGHIFSLKNEQIVGVIVSSVPRNHVLDQLLKQSTFTDSDFERKLQQKIVYSVGIPVLAMGVHDVDRDGYDDILFLSRRHIVCQKLFPHREELFRFSLPLPADQILSQRGLLGKLVLHQQSTDNSLACFIKTSDMASGLVYTVTPNGLTPLAPFTGYPLAQVHFLNQTGVLIGLYDDNSKVFQPDLKIYSTRLRKKSREITCLSDKITISANFRDLAGVLGSNKDNYVMLAADYTLFVDNEDYLFQSVPPVGVGSHVFEPDDENAVLIIRSSVQAPGEGDYVELLLLEGENIIQKIWTSPPFTGNIIDTRYSDLNNDGKAELLVVENQQKEALIHIFSHSTVQNHQ